MRALTRMWQMLLKALEEVATAPNAMMAAEMAIIRLTHVAELPSPEELVRRLGEMPPTPPEPAWRRRRAAARAGRRPRGRAARAGAAPAPRAGAAAAEQPGRWRATQPSRTWWRWCGRGAT